MEWLKKLALISGSTALVLFTSLFVYANWNPPRLAHQAKPAYYAAFDLNGTCTDEQKTLLETSIAKMEGVSAVTVNPSGKIAVIAYNPNKINQPVTFANSINQLSGLKAVSKKWEIDPNVPQCPAHGFLAWLDNAKAFLCIRNK